MSHHATYDTFGGDDMLIKAYEHWSVLCRPAQATKGAMVLIAHADVTRYSDLPAGAFAEMHGIISDIETALEAAYAPDKMNYLMLMMVDPHVHYHVIPRYSDDRPEEDPGWPGPPVLSSSADVSPSEVRDTLKASWP